MNKNSYIRPDVQLVDFSLSSSIAATCNHTASSTDENSCLYKYNGWTIFMATTAGCDFPIEDGGQFCYHVPTDDNRIFAS